MKTNKRKVWKCLKSVKEFSRRFDLANAKLMSVSSGFLQELSKLHIFLRLSIFVKCPTGKFIYARQIKIIENLHFFVFWSFFFQHNSKTKSIVPSLTHKTVKQLLSFVFCRICFTNVLITHALAKGVDHIIKQTKQSQNEKQMFFEILQVFERVSFSIFHAKI